MAFYGPFSLGAFPSEQAVGRVMQQFPGAQVTSYPGAGGVGLSALGFTAPQANLFGAGAMPSTLGQVLAMPQIEGVGAVPPESITGQIGQAGGMGRTGTTAGMPIPSTLGTGGGPIFTGGGVSPSGTTYSGGVQLPGVGMVGGNLPPTMTNPGAFTQWLSGQTGLPPGAVTGIGAGMGAGGPLMLGNVGLGTALNWQNANLLNTANRVDLATMGGQGVPPGSTGLPTGGGTGGVPTGTMFDPTTGGTGLNATTGAPLPGTGTGLLTTLGGLAGLGTGIATGNPTGAAAGGLNTLAGLGQLGAANNIFPAISGALSTPIPGTSIPYLSAAAAGLNIAGIAMNDQMSTEEQVVRAIGAALGAIGPYGSGMVADTMIGGLANTLFRGMTPAMIEGNRYLGAVGALDSLAATLEGKLEPAEFMRYIGDMAHPGDAAPIAVDIRMPDGSYKRLNGQGAVTFPEAVQALSQGGVVEGRISSLYPGSARIQANVNQFAQKVQQQLAMMGGAYLLPEAEALPFRQAVDRQQLLARVRAETWPGNSFAPVSFAAAPPQLFNTGMGLTDVPRARQLLENYFAAPPASGSPFGEESGTAWSSPADVRGPLLLQKYGITPDEALWTRRQERLAGPLGRPSQTLDTSGWGGTGV